MLLPDVILKKFYETFFSAMIVTDEHIHTRQQNMVSDDTFFLDIHDKILIIQL